MYLSLPAAHAPISNFFLARRARSSNVCGEMRLRITNIGIYRRLPCKPTPLSYVAEPQVGAGLKISVPGYRLQMGSIIPRVSKSSKMDFKASSRGIPCSPMASKHSARFSCAVSLLLRWGQRKSPDLIVRVVKTLVISNPFVYCFLASNVSVLPVSV